MKLTVKPLDKQNAGRGLAAIDRQATDELNIESGDYVSLSNEDEEGVARVWPAPKEDTGTGIIRIDGEMRDRIGVSIDDQVEVEEVEIQSAEEISVALPEKLHIQGNLGPLLQDKLGGRPVSAGNIININFGFVGPGQEIPVGIESTRPESPVVVTETTQIEISATPVEALQSTDTHEQSMPKVSYEDIGGLDKELEKVREMVELPMRHPELFERLGIEPPKGLLLHGPPGTGKTLIAQAVANEVEAEIHTISGPEIMSRFYGESEEKLREVFEQASESTPSIIFIDELDSVAPDRDETSDVERRVVAQLLSLMDGLESRGEVVVIGATNRVDAIDPALRRGGRFDREIEIGVPNKKGRKEILQIHTRGMPLADDVNLDEYSENTYGFVGADIENLTKEAAMTTLRRVKPQINLEEDTIYSDLLQSIEVTDNDFKTAMRDIEPSALREVFVEVPDVTWEDVGGLKTTKDRLQETIQWPLDFPKMFKTLDIEAAKGVLLYGPPGTGKTLLAKAVANESQSNFISVKGPELLNKFVGESEKGVREIFSKARENAPTVIFFDEIDAIATERGAHSASSGVTERVVSQLLTELDGLEKLEDVVVIATSNRPDLIDSALLRPGRLDRHVHVPIPHEDARKAIFEVHTRDKPLGDDVDLDSLAKRTEGFVGADIESLCREAAMTAGRNLVNSTPPEEVEETAGEVSISMNDFESALEEVTPSVDEDVQEKYEEIEERFEKNDVDSHEGQRYFQ